MDSRLRDHLTDRAAFVVISPDDPKVMRDFAKGRGWKFPIYSYSGTSFGKDLDFEGDNGFAVAGVLNLPPQSDGKMYRVAHAYFGPGDDYAPLGICSICFPRGTHQWQPKYSYGKKP